MGLIFRGPDILYMNSGIAHTSYGYSKIVSMDFEKAIEKVTEELKKEEFGVLTSIDVKDTLNTKLSVDFRPYMILGACNPRYAHQALLLEEEIGLMLPCNVIVYIDEEGRTIISAMDPLTMMRLVDNSRLEEVAMTIRDKIVSVIDRV
jgi:uncharacterized protein (DUF302 family)